MSRNLIPDYSDNKEGNGMKEKEANDECDPLEYEFDLLEIGCTGTIEVIPQSINKTSKKELKPLTTLPSGLPPLFAPDLKCDLEKYLLDPTSLPIHDFHKTQRFWPRERDSESLLFADVCPVPSTLKVERNPTTGELLGYNEVMLTDTGSTAKNSMSLFATAWTTICLCERRVDQLPLFTRWHGDSGNFKSRPCFRWRIEF